MLSRQSVGTYKGNNLTQIDSSGYACPQSTRRDEPLWTYSWPKGIGANEIISPLKKKKKVQAVNDLLNFRS